MCHPKDLSEHPEYPPSFQYHTLREADGYISFAICHCYSAYCFLSFFRIQGSPNVVYYIIDSLITLIVLRKNIRFTFIDIFMMQCCIKLNGLSAFHYIGTIFNNHLQFALKNCNVFHFCVFMGYRFVVTS